MNRAPLPSYLTLDPASTLPRYRQLHQRVRDAIGAGLLRPGDRIPAARWLAQELGVARGTVAAAVALLAAEGCVETRGAAGAVVTALPVAAEAPAAAPAPARPGQPLDLGAAVAPLALQMGVPALDRFPRKTWARLAAGAARATQARHMLKESAFGAPGLRAAIAAHLRIARGIGCAPEQVFVTAGYRETLHRVARVLLRAGDRAWTEDPGFPPTRHLLGALGIETVPVPVDAGGLAVAQALAMAPAARAAVLTPAHQCPLGVALSGTRRLELLDWAARTGAWLVEDD
ncbi:PLP-dependent aminotransferase family protein [uncultured Massilia sp.]|uniref:aminotransferase-like domain-containing protein n=1 Tax=uncultured Massilia sp. TaxID=169973 RepID=UPI0027D95881|nr:PLP-dependent aminotransferase family protein [uncultured Massilia sp.]